MTRVRRGQVLRIPEADYCYGLGLLVLRVTDVDEQPQPGVEWLRVQGVEVRPDGSDGDRRDVLVRTSALPKNAPP